MHLQRKKHQLCKSGKTYGVLPLSSFHFLGAETAHRRAQQNIKQNTVQNTDNRVEGHDRQLHERTMRAKEWGDSPSLFLFK